MNRPAISAVVLDAMGVIFRSAEDVDELLIPFCRTRGSQSLDAEIRQLYLACSLGRASTRDFWNEVVVASEMDAVELDIAYTKQHELSDGLDVFVRRARQSGLRLACLTNDVSEWSHLLRARFAFGGLFDFWVVSGDVQARKPSPEIYNALLRNSGWDARDCLFVDDRPANVAAARALSFNAVLFGSLSTANEGTMEPAGLARRNFEDLASDWL